MKYYIPVNKVPSGPYTVEEMRLMHLTPDTLVWHENLPQWVKACEIDELRVELFGMKPIMPENWQPSPPPPDPQPHNFNYGYQNSRSSQDNIPPCPSNYLIPAIILTICCCIPAGIVAIIYSSKVDGAYRTGNYDEAYRASSNARLWCIIGLIAGIFSWIFWTIYSVIVSFPVMTHDQQFWNI